MVFVDCHAGFGSRLVRLLTGIATAHHFNHKFKVIWSPEPECDIDFYSLFNNKDIEVITREDYKIQSINRHVKYIGRLIDIEKVLHNLHSEDYIYFDYKVKSNLIPSFITPNKILNVFSECRINDYILKESVNFINNNNINHNVHGMVVRLGDTYDIKTINSAFSILKNKNKRYFVTSDDLDFINSISNFSNVCVYPPAFLPSGKINNEAFSQTYKTVQELKNNHTYYRHFTGYDGRNKRTVSFRGKQSIIDSFITLLILSQTTIHNESISYRSSELRESTFHRIAKLFAESIHPKYLLFNNRKYIS